MRERLHVLMSVSKPRFMARLCRFFLEEMEPHPFELRWHLLVQCNEPDPKGYRKLDEALGWIPDGWVWTPSDDSLHDPSLFRRLGEAVKVTEGRVGPVGAVVFAVQGHRPYPLLARPEYMKPCYVSGVSIFWRRSFLGDERHDFDRHGEIADGCLVERMHRRHPEAFAFVDEPLAWFNSLEQPSSKERGET